MKEVHKPALTANMVMVTDANGNPIASDKINNNELNMLNNIRTNVQTQIDNINSVLAKKGYVDYSSGIDAIGNIIGDYLGVPQTFTAPYDCFISADILWSSISSIAKVYVNENEVEQLSGSGQTHDYVRLFLKNGDVIKFQGSGGNPSIRLRYFKWN